MADVITTYYMFFIKLIIALVGAILVLKFFSMKNQLKQMTPMDIILNFVLSAILSSFILSDDFTVAEFIGVMAIYGVTMYAVGWIIFSTRFGRSFFVGRPRVIIKNGRVDVAMMKKMKINASDVAAVLRQQDIKSINDVKTAQIEPSGELSVVKKGETEYAIVVIDNGMIVPDALQRIGKDDKWLRRELRAHKIKDVSHVFIAQWGRGGMKIVTLN